MSAVSLLRALCLLMLLAVLAPLAAAQDFDFRPPAAVSDPATPAVMRDLAERVLPVYQEDNPERYLANLSALQLVAGNYAAAYESRQSLRYSISMRMPGPSRRQIGSRSRRRSPRHTGMSSRS
jgi:hypothetical protein